MIACGGSPVNSVDDLEADMLGWTGKIYEEVLGDDKYTFVTGPLAPPPPGGGPQ